MAILSIGHIGNNVEKAIEQVLPEGLNPAHYDLRFVKPLDEELLHEVFQKFEKVITIEDGTITGGLGSAIFEFQSEHNYSARVKRLGVPDHFIEQGTIPELHHECGFDVEGIVNAIKTFMA